MKIQISGIFVHIKFEDLNMIKFMELNPEIEKYAYKLNRPISKVSKDTGDGYYSPEKGIIFIYDNFYLREPNEEEEEWII